jgi:peptidylprolyl isomerase/peptidyl-prolyl cis-trans isomerase B (cyclophilin B)
MKKFGWIGISLLAFALAGCASAPSVKSNTNEGSTPAKMENQAQDSQAVIETEKGTIVFSFYKDDAPKTVENFIKLTKQGFYNGLTFHRVEPGFVIQGGDPNGNGMGGPGYTIKAEFNSRPHVKGTVAMARSNDPDSAGSQFYICLGDAHFLDRKYTVFGQVTEGQDAVDKIRRGDKMVKVTIK